MGTDYFLSIDPVSGVANRRALELLLDRLYDAFVRGERVPGGFVVIAVLGLGALNETHGHDRGDRFLRAFATALTATFPRGRIFRYAGDAFAIRFEERLDPVRVRGGADRAVDRVLAEGFDSIAASVGVANLDEADGSPRGALRLADARRREPPAEPRA